MSYRSDPLYCRGLRDTVRNLRDHKSFLIDDVRLIRSEIRDLYDEMKRVSQTEKKLIYERIQQLKSDVEARSSAIDSIGDDIWNINQELDAYCR